MEDYTSGDSAALLTPLRALSRRGAFLQQTLAGGDILSTSGRRRPGPQGITALQLDQALAGGLIRAIGPGQYVLTRRGAQAVRRARMQSAVTAARAARPGRAGAAARQAQDGSGSQPRINVSESPLSWLRQRKGGDGKPLISDLEFDAGERLRADFWFAQMTPRVTSSWSATPGDGQRRSAPGAGIDIADNVIAARERVNRALVAVGPELSGALVDVCCFLKGLEQVERERRLPPRSGKVFVQFALRALARHYGLDRRGSSGMRHWGSAGYRPAIKDEAVCEEPG